MLCPARLLSAEALPLASPRPQVRLQTQPTHAPVYSGFIDCARKTLQWEGIRGLYKGCGSMVQWLVSLHLDHVALQR